MSDSPVEQFLIAELEEIIHALRDLGLTENDIQHKVTQTLDEWRWKSDTN